MLMTIMTDEARVNIYFFAKSRELVGQHETELVIHPSDQKLTEVFNTLLQKFPSLETIRNNLVIAHNQEYIENWSELLHFKDGDEIAIIPPISGDFSQKRIISSPARHNLYLALLRLYNYKTNIMDSLEIIEEPLQIEKITNEVTANSCGAISIFSGTTRDNFNGKKVVRLEYEAYKPMALKQMKYICTEIRNKWKDVEHIAMHHRIGLVPIGESSIIIAISSPHRQAALEAVHYAIDTLKAKVPIWKKEIYEEGEDQWKENKECFWLKSK